MTHVKSNRFISFLGLLIITVSSVITTLGSGGGGGGGGGPQPLVYSGNTDHTTITITNAATLIGDVLFGGITSANVPTAASISSNNMQSGSTAAMVDYLLTAFHYSLDDYIGNAVSGYNIPVSFHVDETVSCESGHYTLNGTLDDFTGTGTLSFNYVDCLIEGVTYNGSGSFTINYMDYSNMDTTMSFTLMSMVSSEFNGSMSGSMQLQLSVSGNTGTEIITMDIVAKDNNTGKMYKFENLVMTAVIDDIYSQNSGGSIAFTGSSARVYDSDYGYIIVDTPTPLLYSSITLIYPDNGGVMTFTGNNSSMQLTVISGRHVKLDLDMDGIDGYEAVRYLLWEELAVNANTDLTDSDSDGMHDSWETTYGLNPNIADSASDLDSDTFSNLTEYQSGTNPNDATSHP